jgi:Flp pilus assembly pilin Flp
VFFIPHQWIESERMALAKVRFRLDHRSEEGQAMVEYGLLLALITVVTITALTAIGTNVEALLDAIATRLAEITAGL